MSLEIRSKRSPIPKPKELTFAYSYENNKDYQKIGSDILDRDVAQIELHQQQQQANGGVAEEGWNWNHPLSTLSCGFIRILFLKNFPFKFQTFLIG
jgi:hypothetical protein